MDVESRRIDDKIWNMRVNLGLLKKKSWFNLDIFVFFPLSSILLSKH